MKYEWRLGSEITLLSSLTLSQAKDNGAGALENQNGNFPAPQDINNLAADYGVSGYNQPYNSTTSFVWSLPFGHGKRWGNSLSSAMDVLVGGWQLAGINTITPGEMVTLTYSPAAAFQVSAITNDFSGANNYRPNLTCDPYAAAGQQSITNWFNAACVAIPTDPSQPFGNAPRNNVRGPNYWTVDMAASKSVPLGGQARLQIRVEAFNLFNRVNFTPPAANRSNGNVRHDHVDLRRASGAARRESALVKTRTNVADRYPQRPADVMRAFYRQGHRRFDDPHGVDGRTGRGVIGGGFGGGCGWGGRRRGGEGGAWVLGKRLRHGGGSRRRAVRDNASLASLYRQIGFRSGQDREDRFDSAAPPSTQGHQVEREVVASGPDRTQRTGSARSTMPVSDVALGEGSRAEME